MKIAFKVGDKEVVFLEFGLFPYKEDKYIIGIKNIDELDKEIIEQYLKNNFDLQMEESDLILDTPEKYYYFREVNFEEVIKRSGKSFAIGFAFFNTDGKFVEQKIKFIDIEFK